MLNNIGDLINEVLVRSGVSTTTTTSGGLYTDTILNSWVNSAHRWAASYKKWPFTEGRVSTTYAGTEEIPYPENFKTDSIRFITIDGERFQKTNFEDYVIFRDERPDANDKIFSDFSRIYFINPSAGLSGTLWAYGQYLVASLDTTDLTATTIFSNAEEDGNEAIVEEMISYARMREKKTQEAEYHHQRAQQLLDKIWEKNGAEQFAYQAKDRGMFSRVNIVNGRRWSDEIKRDQF